MSRRARRRVRRVRNTMFGSLMGIWIVLPLLPLVGALCSWWVGVR